MKKLNCFKIITKVFIVATIFTLMFTLTSCKNKKPTTDTSDICNFVDKECD